MNLKKGVAKYKNVDFGQVPKWQQYMKNQSPNPHAMLSFDDSYREQEEMLGVQEELPQIQKSQESPFNMTTHEGNFKTLAMQIPNASVTDQFKEMSVGYNSRPQVYSSDMTSKSNLPQMRQRQLNKEDQSALIYKIE